MRRGGGGSTDRRLAGQPDEEHAQQGREPGWQVGPFAQATSADERAADPPCRCRPRPGHHTDRAGRWRPTGEAGNGWCRQDRDQRPGDAAKGWQKRGDACPAGSAVRRTHAGRQQEAVGPDHGAAAAVKDKGHCAAADAQHLIPPMVTLKRPFAGRGEVARRPQAAATQAGSGDAGRPPLGHRHAGRRERPAEQQHADQAQHEALDDRLFRLRPSCPAALTSLRLSARSATLVSLRKHP